MSIVEDFEPGVLWKHFDEIRKIPHCSKHEEKIREYIVDFAEEHDLDYKVDDIGNVVIKKQADPGMEDKPIVVLQGHMDMVCEKNNDVDHDFSKDPIKLEKDGDVLKAKGTTLGADNGIGLAASLAVLEEENLETGRIEALYTVDEETGLTGAFALSEDMLEGDIMLNLDSEEFNIITVGCAGGGDTEITLPIEKEKISENMTGLKISVSGLKGGHSGIDIHEQRGNAIKIISRMLWKTIQGNGVRITTLKGGDKHNAIPREAEATISVGEDKKEETIKQLEDEKEDIADELKPIDPDLKVDIEEVKPEKGALKLDSQSKLINLLNGLPHGVEKMSYDIEGLVQTSTNLAKVTVEEDKAEILLSSRSSIMSELHALRAKIRSIANLTGAEIEEEDPYPGWKPDMDSELLKKSKKVFKDMFDEEPEVEAIHAGLECGIIGEKYDGMDMISIGPTIKAPHSPDERVYISTVKKFYDYLVEILKEI
ncbi:MAG: aminoacyl-histidine dipeptidase [Candidatus Thermoplasmatota archaeon]